MVSSDSNRKWGVIAIPKAFQGWSCGLFRRLKCMSCSASAILRTRPGYLSPLNAAPSIAHLFSTRAPNFSNDRSPSWAALTYLSERKPG